jgi:hypothetical protein
VSLSCFSQTGISKDTTKVVISQQVAKQIAKDLIRLDGCVEELKLTQEKLILTQQRESIFTFISYSFYLRVQKLFVYIVSKEFIYFENTVTSYLKLHATLAKYLAKITCNFKRKESLCTLAKIICNFNRKYLYFC